MKISLKILFVLFTLFVFNLMFLFAQTTDHTCQKHKIGYLVSFGDQKLSFVSLALPYSYKVMFFEIDYCNNLSADKTWELDLIFQPQFNITEYKPDNDQEKYTSGYEYGLNVGLCTRFKLIPDLFNIYTILSIGPNYVSGVPNRQRSGFLFANNIIAGINFQLSDHWYFDLRIGFRHLSNAGFNSPNRGINNLIISGGVLFDLIPGEINL